MSDFQQQAVKLAGRQNSPEWLAALRYEGAEQWLNTPWPTRKTEAWKYTPLRSLQEREFTAWGECDSSWQDEISLLPIDGPRLVFVNGVLDRGASDALPAEATLFTEADDAQRRVIEENLGRMLDPRHYMFAALSNAWAEEGVLLHLPHNAVLDQPLYVVHVSTAQAQPAVASNRLLVVLETGAQAELIEHYVSTATEQNGFVNALTEVSVGDNARLRHTRINLEQENLLHVGGVHAALQRDARYEGFTLAEGSDLKRIDYHLSHRATGAHVALDGVYLARNRQLVDYHTNIEHISGHCTSEEVFRGIVGDRARAVFNGRIHIHPQAQKTLAELNNRNLLTSRKAEVDTKPELEIYADDVQCAHGATVSQLDEMAMYYLRSRGLSDERARTMLSFAFINELLQRVPQAPVQEALAAHLTRLFSTESSLIGQKPQAAIGTPESASHE